MIKQLALAFSDNYFTFTDLTGEIARLAITDVHAFF